ncbi:MAG: isoprenyl transferase [Deltaproteobacteria bacterium]|nr:isoprenyl transferase [Deltaproteobacteria bacterium]
MKNLDKNRLPRHLAIIMDGNGRWAQAKGLRRSEGHRAAADSVRSVTRASRELGIKALTLFAFSSENWGRPRLEVQLLMGLFNRYLKSELTEMLGNGIRLNAIGDLERLPRATRNLMRETMERTASNQDMVLTLAMSYGGRQDVVEAARAVARQCLAGELKPEDVTEDVFGGFVSTADLPDLDLLIRTGGEYRLSNFMLWQTAYTELYFTPTLFPDFRAEELFKIIADYQERERRFGKTSEQIEN